MDRRQFLVMTGGGAAAAALAAWTGGCFRRPDHGDPSRGGAVRSPDPDRPLLVLLVPADQSEGFHRGRLVGGLLNHGKDEALADLARVDLVCATADRLPETARPPEGSSPWFVLLTREAERIGSHPFVPEVPPEVDTSRRGRSDEPWEKTEERALARVHAFGDQLHAFLGPLLGPSNVDVAHLAEQVRARYVKKPPPGAYWTVSTGCGTHTEGIVEQHLVACGMGMVPEASQRFLDFYVKV